jgi:hypothetical protein
MATLDLKDVRIVRFEPLTRTNKTRVRLRFDTSGASQYESISFEFACGDALTLAHAIQEFLSPGSNPIPPTHVPSGGRPKLRIVK